MVSELSVERRLPLEFVPRISFDVIYFSKDGKRNIKWIPSIEAMNIQLTLDFIGNMDFGAAESRLKIVIWCSFYVGTFRTEK